MEINDTTIAELSYNEYARLYKERIKDDFPRAERRPLGIVKKMYKTGTYKCFALTDGSVIDAYAAFICDESRSSVLLDLYAVDKNRRGTGIGSEFFSLLAGLFPDKKGIILECENPDGAKRESERKTRERRIAFYLRNGAEMTGVKWRAFGVSYDILYLAAAPNSDGNAENFDRETVKSDLVGLYKIGLPRPVSKLFLKLLN